MPKVNRKQVKACDLPPQQSDREPVDPNKPNGPQWGELFGRKRITTHAEVVEAMDAKPVPICKACGDTGRNSKGGQCLPCVRSGRVLDEAQSDDLFA